jgi:hypothetical protein
MKIDESQTHFSQLSDFDDDVAESSKAKYSHN